MDVNARSAGRRTGINMEPKVDTLLDEIFKDHFYCKVLWSAIKDIHDGMPDEVRENIWETPSEEILQVMNEVLEEDDVWANFITSWNMSA